MSRIISAAKGTRLDNIEAFMSAVSKDMRKFYEMLGQLTLLSEAHSRLLGMDKVNDEANALLKEKREAAQTKVVQPDGQST